MVDGDRSGRYDPHAIEAARQEAWRARAAFRTPPIADDRRHVYVKASAPFTSGNVHMGHVRSYSIGDAYARFRRARGDDVLIAFGYDAFGLPAELAAIAGGLPPAEWVESSAANMTRQLQRLGFSFDWERSFMSSEPVMYRWSQWLFLLLLEHDLVYRGTGNVDWCDNCQTTLATIQVEPGGTCWRCHGPVRLIELPQWYLRISPFLEENDRRLAERAESGAWDEVALASQQVVLGRVDGVELDLDGLEGRPLTVFTPHRDALGQALFVLMSPRHAEADLWADDPSVAELLEQMRTGGWERSAREAETIPLVATARTARAPDGRELPVVISPLVDSRYGVTAVLAIPPADRADEVVARRLGIDVDVDADAADAEQQHTPMREAVRYRAFDFTISRQRSWGTPIPIVYCEECGPVPVPAQELPVELPRDLRPTGMGNPLAEREDFVRVSCPRCGGPGRRETDTLDGHFDALWLWVPACVPPEHRQAPLEEIFALADLRAWLPSERLVAGSDSGNFVFDQRTVTKALRDLGPLAFLGDGEPFAGCLFHEMVIRDGRKMSKHLGNVVEPDELVDRYGADTIRLAVLYAARPQRSLNWDDSAVLRAHRYLGQVWELTSARAAEARAAGDPPLPPADELPDPEREQTRDGTEHLRVRLLKWCATATEKVTEDMAGLEMHTAVRNVMRLFDRIKDFEKRVAERHGELNRDNRTALLIALRMHAQMLSPFAPHIAEELWLALGGEEGGVQLPWPGVSFQVAA